MPELVQIFFITVVIMLAFFVIFFMAYSFLYPEEGHRPPKPPPPPEPPTGGYYLAVEYEGIRYYLGEKDSAFEFQTELPSAKFYGEDGEDIKYGNLPVHYVSGGTLSTGAGIGPVKIMLQSVTFGGGFWLLTNGPCSVYRILREDRRTMITKKVVMITNPVYHCYYGTHYVICGSKHTTEAEFLYPYLVYFAKLVD